MCVCVCVSEVLTWTRQLISEKRAPPLRRRQLSRVQNVRLLFKTNAPEPVQRHQTWVERHAGRACVRYETLAAEKRYNFKVIWFKHGRDQSLVSSYFVPVDQEFQITFFIFNK